VKRICVEKGRRGFYPLHRAVPQESANQGAKNNYWVGKKKSGRSKKVDRGQETNLARGDAMTGDKSHGEKEINWGIRRVSIWIQKQCQNKDLHQHAGPISVGRHLEGGAKEKERAERPKDHD